MSRFLYRFKIEFLRLVRFPIYAASYPVLVGGLLFLSRLSENHFPGEMFGFWAAIGLPLLVSCVMGCRVTQQDVSDGYRDLRTTRSDGALYEQLVRLAVIVTLWTPILALTVILYWIEQGTPAFDSVFAALILLLIPLSVLAFAVSSSFQTLVKLEPLALPMSLFVSICFVFILEELFSHQALYTLPIANWTSIYSIRFILLDIGTILLVATILPIGCFAVRNFKPGYKLFLGFFVLSILAGSVYPVFDKSFDGLLESNQPTQLAVPNYIPPALVRRQIVMLSDGLERIEVSLDVEPISDEVEFAAFAINDHLRVASDPSGDHESKPIMMRAAQHNLIILPVQGQNQSFELTLEPSPKSRRRIQSLVRSPKASLGDIAPWYAVPIALDQSEPSVRYFTELLLECDVVFEAPDSHWQQWSDASNLVPLVGKANLEFNRSEESEGSFSVLGETKTVSSSDFERLSNAAFAPLSGFLSSVPQTQVELVDFTVPGIPYYLSRERIESLTSELIEAEDEEPYRRLAPFMSRFESLHRQVLMSTLLKKANSDSESAMFVRAMGSYLHDHALRRGRPLTSQQRSTSQVFQPWESQKRETFPFDVNESDVATWLSPLSEEDLRHEVRLEGIVHYARYLLGDPALANSIRQVTERGQTSQTTIGDWFESFEENSGVETRELLDAWRSGLLLPSFEIVQAEVELYRDVEKSTFNYVTTAIVDQVGTGTVTVPIVLIYDGGAEERRVELSANQPKELVFETPSRPISLAIDPHGWIPQVPRFDVRSQSRQHAIIFLKRVVDRTEEN